MADKNIQKALYGPSWFEVALGAILGIAVGVVAACLYFIFKPVEKVDRLPKELAANVVYLVPGKDSTTRAKGWQAKQKIFVDGGEIELREEELNAWAATLSDYKPVDPKAPKPTPAPAKPAAAGKPAAAAKPLEPEAEANEVFFAVGAPNFSIKENRLQIAVVCRLNYYGIGSDVWVKITGRFVRNGDIYKFVPAEYYFGSCPLHLIPGSGDFLSSRILAELKITDDMLLAWSKVNLAMLEGEQLKIATKP